MATIVGSAIAGSLAASVYEKVDHHLYNKVNDKLGFDLFEVEEENKNDKSENIKKVVAIKNNDSPKEIYILHIVSILSVAVFVTYGTYKFIDYVKTS